jgi:beta-alanine--pyruvate transaminase
MGAVAARQAIYDTITNAGPEKGVEFFHGYTYSAHPASCAAGLAMMDIFAKDRLIEKAAAMSPKFMAAIHSLRDCPIVTDIRSVGLMAAVDVAMDGAPGARGHEAQKRLYDTGLNLKSTGDALIIAPPFIMDDKHLDEIVSKLRTVLMGL